MAADTLTLSPGAVAAGRAVMFRYPPGRTRSDYARGGAVLSVGPTTYAQGSRTFDLSYEVSGVLLSWHGGAIDSGFVWSLACILAPPPGGVLTPQTYGDLTNNQTAVIARQSLADDYGFIASYTRGDGRVVSKASPVSIDTPGIAPDFRFNAVGVRMPDGLDGLLDFFSFATADDDVQIAKNLAIGGGGDATVTESGNYPFYGRDYTRFGGGSYMEFATDDVVSGTYFAAARFAGPSGLATLFDNYDDDVASYFNNAINMGTYFQLGATSLVGRVTTAKPTTPSMPAHDASLTITPNYSWRLFAMSFGNDSLTMEDLTTGLSTTVAAPVQTWRMTKGATTARIGSSLAGANQQPVDLAFVARFRSVLSTVDKAAFRTWANAALASRGIIL